MNAAQQLEAGIQTEANEWTVISAEYDRQGLGPLLQLSADELSALRDESAAFDFAGDPVARAYANAARHAARHQYRHAEVWRILAATWSADR